MKSVVHGWTQLKSLCVPLANWSVRNNLFQRSKDRSHSTMHHRKTERSTSELSQDRPIYRCASMSALPLIATGSLHCAATHEALMHRVFQSQTATLSRKLSISARRLPTEVST